MSIAVADVNGDGKPDIVVGNREHASISVLLGAGDGTFKAKVEYAAGSKPYWVAISTATAGPICWSPATSIAT